MISFFHMKELRYEEVKWFVQIFCKVQAKFETQSLWIPV